MLPQPIVQTHAGIQVVRDDLLPGGTKMRAIVALMQQAALSLLGRHEQDARLHHSHLRAALAARAAL